MSATLKGSREAFGLLVVRYSGSVRAVCLARTGNHDDLDDLVQESFLRAFKGLGRLRERASFGAYLHKIARNVCVDSLRRRRGDAVPLDDTVDLRVAVDGPLDVREERLERLRLLVGRLPLALREAVLMFYFERRSCEQIAGCLGVTEAAVSQRLHRARVTLREAFGAGKEGGP